MRPHCFFVDLAGSERDQFEERRVFNRYKKNQVVVYEGVEPHGVYLLCEGRTTVFKTDEQGHQLTVRLGHPGELIGYRSLLLSKPYSASVASIETSVVAFLDRGSFFDILDRSRPTTSRLIRNLALQLGQAEDKALKMAYHSSTRRIAELLDGVKPQEKTNHTDGPILLPPLRRQDLADMAGLALETTIRVLKSMEQEGVIRMKGRLITILDTRRLTELAQPLH
ncbi:MAG: Crp/Fnr family transcriptional regulator [Nitrospirae bacterium]|nr:Crp/Fnr family transcriptional regulator [Nitrospirota bacterium]